MNAPLIALFALFAASRPAVAETLPIVRVGGGYAPNHGGAEVSVGVGGLLVGKRVNVVGDLAFDYRGSDGKVLSLGAGVVLPLPLETVSFIVAPKFLIGAVDDASARGVRGSLYVVGAGLVYVELGYDYLWKDPMAEGSLRISAGINLGWIWWIPEAAVR